MSIPENKGMSALSKRTAKENRNTRKKTKISGIKIYYTFAKNKVCAKYTFCLFAVVRCNMQCIINYPFPFSCFSVGWSVGVGAVASCIYTADSNSAVVILHISTIYLVCVLCVRSAR